MPRSDVSEFRKRYPHGLQDWIVGQALEAESRWHVDATPSFVINGKLYTGAMTADQFATILAG